MFNELISSYMSNLSSLSEEKIGIDVNPFKMLCKISKISN